MEICGHCHNVLPKTVDRCTVCGTARVDPAAADVRRRDNGDQPSHAPGWAAPSVPETGIHPDDFLRELAGEPPAPATPSGTPPPEVPTLPPRSIPATPAPGALASYLGTTVDRRPATNASDLPVDAGGQPGPQPPPPGNQTAPTEAARFAQHLSTATRVAPDGVAARTTRLDGTVKLGPTPTHRALAFGAPLLAGLLLVGGVLGSYRIRTSQAEEIEAAAAESAIDSAAVMQTRGAVVRLDLDGCGIIDQTTGFLFADNTILASQSSIVTDNRPTVTAADGSVQSAEILGWSLIRNLAVIRPEERLVDGLEWGVASRVRSGDAVSVLAISGPGIASPVPATITSANTLNGRNSSFELDITAAEGSLVLNANGFVIGVMDSQNLAQASDDVAPAISRVVLANERPQAVCPAPPTTDETTAPPANADGTAKGPEDTPVDE